MLEGKKGCGNKLTSTENWVKTFLNLDSLSIVQKFSLEIESTTVGHVILNAV